MLTSSSSPVYKKNNSPALPIDPASFKPQPVKDQPQPVANQPKQVADRPQQVQDQPLLILDRQFGNLTQSHFFDIMENLKTMDLNYHFKIHLQLLQGLPSLISYLRGVYLNLKITKTWVFVFVVLKSIKAVAPLLIHQSNSAMSSVDFVTGKKITTRSQKLWSIWLQASIAF